MEHSALPSSRLNVQQKAVFVAALLLGFENLFSYRSLRVEKRLQENTVFTSSFGGCSYIFLMSGFRDAGAVGIPTVTVHRVRFSLVFMLRNVILECWRDEII